MRVEADTLLHVDIVQQGDGGEAEDDLVVVARSGTAAAEEAHVRAGQAVAGPGLRTTTTTTLQLPGGGRKATAAREVVVSVLAEAGRVLLGERRLMV